MNAKVDVVHPVPMRLVRQGCRKPEDRFVRVTTPVTLADADLSGFRPLGTKVGEGKRAVELFEHEGRVWSQFLLRPVYASPRSVRPFELKAWLANPADTSSLMSDIGGHLDGTPMRRCAIRSHMRDRHSHMVSWLGTRDRGADQDGGKVKEVLFDGEGLARGAVRDFFADRIRVVGQKVFIRVVPVARFYDDGHPPIRFRNLSLETAGELSFHKPHLYARPDRAGSLIKDWGVWDDRHARMVEEVSGSIPAELLDDSLAGLAANLMPRLAVGLVEAMSGVRDVDRDVHADMLRRVEGLRPEALLGAVGAVPDWESAIRVSADTFKRIAEAYPEGPETMTARRLGGHIKRRLAPLFERPIDPADVEAIGAIRSPGG